MPLLLSIDPGEAMCGVVLSDCEEGDRGNAKMIMAVRLENNNLGAFIERWHGDAAGALTIAYENYQVYSHKLELHRHSNVKTVRAIGIIEYTASKHNIRVVNCYAKDWKQAITDSFLQRYGFWPSVNAKDNRHIRDAAGIGIYFFRIKGIFAGGKRVLTSLDLQILED